MKSDSNHWRSNTLIQKGIPLKDYAEITQQIVLTLSNIIDFNNISLTEIGLKNFNGYHWNIFRELFKRWIYRNSEGQNQWFFKARIKKHWRINIPTILYSIFWPNCHNGSCELGQNLTVWSDDYENSEKRKMRSIEY